MKLIFSPSRSPSFNLAAEEFLFSEKTDEYLLLYVNKPCVILGSNQSVTNEVNEDFCHLNGISIFRRLSGGGAVYHDEGNLNFCFVFNKKKGYSPLSSDFLQPVISVLNSMEIPVEVGKRKDLWLPDGNKVSGTASHVSKCRELHHGTLLYDVDMEKLQKSLIPTSATNKKAIRSVPSPVENIRSFLERSTVRTQDVNDFFITFTKLMLAYFQIRELSLLLNEDIKKIYRLTISKYGRKEWNYRI